MVEAVQDTVKQIPKAAPKTFMAAKKGTVKTSKAVNITARQAKSKVKKAVAKTSI